MWHSETGHFVQYSGSCVGVLQLNSEKQLLKIETSREGDVNIRFTFYWILYFHPKQLLCDI